MSIRHAVPRYWTIQSQDAWESAQKIGFLHGHAKHIMFSEPYHWMMSQMGQRLSGYDGSYPVWVWTEKPDLLQLHHYTGRAGFVCLTLELKHDEVLLSDFDEWHAVLNDTFNARTRREWLRYCAGRSAITKEESWQRIFELEPPVVDHVKRDGQQTRRLQGVTGAVPLERVIRVEHLDEALRERRLYYV
ncbi:DUF3841 domain-containing protein [Paenibacillus campi]|uniref:DUF3841 domain-containing protein n=1 Tax=Paenibacillus campi TaxID=3106031 RepID=UPI002AFE31F0|nr:DUF3841 domain-containing protein [Paenibacillus sp. SGZ-1014]